MIHFKHVLMEFYLIIWYRLQKIDVYPVFPILPVVVHVPLPLLPGMVAHPNSHHKQWLKFGYQTQTTIRQKYRLGITQQLEALQEEQKKGMEYRTQMDQIFTISFHSLKLIYPLVSRFNIICTLTIFLDVDLLV